MNLLKGDQRLSDSKIAEVRKIAGFYDGVINASYAKELSNMLAASYSNLYPSVLLTKKKAEEYCDARYVKLRDAVGYYGFDYVVTALKQGKAYVADPANGIDEKHMLNALRWEERREGVEPVSSNERHRRKGLQLVGLGDMTEELFPYTFIIASVYELLTPGNQSVTMTESVKEETEEDVRLTKADMVAAFIDNAHLLKDFYGTSKPEIPKGFPEEELYEGSYTHTLAKQGMFKDCEAVLKYVDDLKKYDSCRKRIAEIFSEEEVCVITEKAESVQEILRLVASL